MRKGSLGIFLGVLLFLAATVSAQTTQEDSGMIKTATGVLVISNEPGNYYTIHITGKTVKPVPDRPFWFTVDGKFFQIVTARKIDFLTKGADKDLDDKAILMAHHKWESDYISETLNRKLKLNTSWQKLAGGMIALAWDYDMPQVADKQTAMRQLYLAVVKGDRVLAVNTVVEGNDREEDLRALLTNTILTLKPSDKPLSLKTASEQVKKGNQ